MAATSLSVGTFGWAAATTDSLSVGTFGWAAAAVARRVGGGPGGFLGKEKPCGKKPCKIDDDEDVLTLLFGLEGYW